jgi:hypothetical protein
MRYTVEVETACSVFRKNYHLVEMLLPLTCMVEGGYESEKDARIRYSLPKVGREQVDKILPVCVPQSERHDQKVTQCHEEGSHSDKISKLAPP